MESTGGLTEGRVDEMRRRRSKVLTLQSHVACRIVSNGRHHRGAADIISAGVWIFHLFP